MVGSWETNKRSIPHKTSKVCHGGGADVKTVGTTVLLVVMALAYRLHCKNKVVFG
jgi:hypothetical protein